MRYLLLSHSDSYDDERNMFLPFNCTGGLCSCKMDRIFGYFDIIDGVIDTSEMELKYDDKNGALSFQYYKYFKKLEDNFIFAQEQPHEIDQKSSILIDLFGPYIQQYPNFVVKVKNLDDKKIIKNF